MGSEGPSVVKFHVTGFKKFHGVAENPTETIVSNLKAYMQKKGIPEGVVLGSCNVLETAGYGALAPLYQTLESAIAGKDSESSNSEKIIWIHFGVNSGATRFAIELQAVNEATFRCPDELGWKPQKVPIISSDGSISQTRKVYLGPGCCDPFDWYDDDRPSWIGSAKLSLTSLPVYEIAKALVQTGHKVASSDDAGRFVCNYVYYHSLRFAEQHGMKSLFVHVPLFLTIDEETQMQFAASLLEGMFGSSWGSSKSEESSPPQNNG